jgi:hypothetical protein
MFSCFTSYSQCFPFIISTYHETMLIQLFLKTPDDTNLLTKSAWSRLNQPLRDERDPSEKSPLKNPPFSDRVKRNASHFSGWIRLGLWIFKKKLVNGGFVMVYKATNKHHWGALILYHHVSCLEVILRYSTWLSHTITYTNSARYTASTWILSPSHPTHPHLVGVVWK